MVQHANESTSFDVRLADGTYLAVKLDFQLSNTPTAKPVTGVPTTKPANPAFERCLRVRPMRIGLRYLGD